MAINARLAQLVERGTFNPKAKGSSPLSGDENIASDINIFPCKYFGNLSVKNVIAPRADIKITKYTKISGLPFIFSDKIRLCKNL